MFPIDSDCNNMYDWSLTVGVHYSYLYKRELKQCNNWKFELWHCCVI